MNDQFIHGVIFDWDRIDNDSYLKKIEAFKGVEKLDFNKAITFLWEKMAAVNRLCWKHLLWHMVLIRRVEQRIIFFLLMIHIQNYVMQ